MAKEIYLDNAAGTVIDPRVIAASINAMGEAGNPSAFNDAGRRARAVLEGARTEVAKFLGARPQEIVFCSSGSEANTLAILGVLGCVGKTASMITTTIEHASVLESARQVQKVGHQVAIVEVDAEGVVSVDSIMQQVDERTALISVMYANNEIGSIQPIQKLATALRQWRKEHKTSYPYLHVDACQAGAYLPMNVQALGVDLLSFNGSKIYGPRGVAALFVRRGVEVSPLILGGHQEHSLRAGTENVAGAVGLAKAVSLITPASARKVEKMRDYGIRVLTQAVPEAKINGPRGKNRLANNIHLSIPGLTSEELLLELDREGIRAGSGSACTAHSVEPSHVLQAIGLSKKYLGGALRFSLSRSTTTTDVDRVAQVLPKIIQRLHQRT
jgi:cysteine desulfurase